MSAEKTDPAAEWLDSNREALIAAMADAVDGVRHAAIIRELHEEREREVAQARMISENPSQAWLDAIFATVRLALRVASSMSRLAEKDPYTVALEELAVLYPLDSPPEPYHGQSMMFARTRGSAHRGRTITDAENIRLRRVHREIVRPPEGYAQTLAQGIFSEPRFAPGMSVRYVGPTAALAEWEGIVREVGIGWVRATKGTQKRSSLIALPIHVEPVLDETQ